MAETNDSEDLERSEGIDVPELALGLSLIGLGAVLVFKALTRNRGKGGPQAVHRVPTDITFTRRGNQITATVKLDGANPTGTVPMTVAYHPAADVTSPTYSCTAAQNSPTAKFTFTVGTIPPGQAVNVTVATIGCTGTGCSITKPFP